MAVLVTGAAGLVGHAVRRRLVADGVDAVSVDLVQVSDDGTRQEVCNLRDADSVDALVAGRSVEAIVHCGGVSGPMVAPDDPRTVIEANIGGTTNLLEAARRHAVGRIVYCSSIAAYGSTATGPVQESAPLRPLDVYGATKAAGEHLVAAYHHEHGVSGVSLRLTTVYGPRRRTACLIRSLLADAVAGRVTRVGLAADAPQQYVHVDDVAAAVVAALSNTAATGAYNISGGTVRTVQEVIDDVTVAEPRVRAESAPPDPEQAARWPAQLDLTAARRDLGWQPEVEFIPAVRAMRDALAGRG